MVKEGVRKMYIRIRDCLILRTRTRKAIRYSRIVTPLVKNRKTMRTAPIAP